MHSPFQCHCTSRYGPARFVRIWRNKHAYLILHPLLRRRARRLYPTASTSAMGSLADGTMCSYCDEHAAGYIPDGCCGPLCGVCTDAALAGGFDQVCILRLQRWLRAHLWHMSPREPRRPHTLAESVFHHPLVALHISQFMIVVADGWAVRSCRGACAAAAHPPQ